MKYASFDPTAYGCSGPAIRRTLRRQEGMATEEAGWLLTAAGAYLFAVMPHFGRRAGQMKGRFYAHRGLHNRKQGIPENTMAAFRSAVEAGYGIELDVQLTKDSEVVVFHDFDLKRICSVDGAVSDFTYRELSAYPVCGTQERIPRLEDVLELVGGRVPLLVELKYKNFGSRICERADALLQKYRGDYVIQSFHPWALRWYRRHRPEVCRGQLAMNFQRQEGHYHPAYFAVRHLLLNFLGRPDFISYDIRDRDSVSQTLCRKLFGCTMAGWTVRSQQQLEKAKNHYDAYIFEGFRPRMTKPAENSA